MRLKRRILRNFVALMRTNADQEQRSLTVLLVIIDRPS
jgi:hypothetical protein